MSDAAPTIPTGWQLGEVRDMHPPHVLRRRLEIEQAVEAAHNRAPGERAPEPKPAGYRAWLAAQKGRKI